jgi:beta-1,4-N-acetylglucosaminyltransferase
MVPVYFGFKNNPFFKQSLRQDLLPESFNDELTTKRQVLWAIVTKVLVTVGTTAFDALVRYFDSPVPGFNFTFQIADGEYVPRYGECHRFILGLGDKFSEFDLVVSHAGAGSVYSLLPMRDCSVLVVPNLGREDPHQLELASYLGDNELVAVMTMEELTGSPVEESIRMAMEFRRAQYKKEEFFVLGEILSFFGID